MTTGPTDARENEAFTILVSRQGRYLGSSNQRQISRRSLLGNGIILRHSRNRDYCSYSQTGASVTDIPPLSWDEPLAIAGPTTHKAKFGLLLPILMALGITADWTASPSPSRTHLLGR
ncbi:hypothetical protein EJ02DRAFT_265972 [Clathrospora elynae]|uniref:Uncharacterized protein n=1 Tax=Clathrospora elynae TaxID=706981 RepID=A0A6A5SHL6_9PLEO|nr:hypothetical protein EJ02DRAFT_265972 [Clathrospora elynae]